MYLDITSITIIIITLFIIVIIIIFYYYYHYIRIFIFYLLFYFIFLTFYLLYFLNFYFCSYHCVILLRYYYQEILTLYQTQKINLCRGTQVKLKQQSHGKLSSCINFLRFYPSKLLKSYLFLFTEGRDCIAPKVNIRIVIFSTF